MYFMVTVTGLPLRDRRPTGRLFFAFKMNHESTQVKTLGGYRKLIATNPPN